jgi:hypothetical protein
MIIQTAPAGEPRLAVMMHEHTALAGQFARAFGNARFEPIEPADLMVYVIAHHDEGWAAFDRNPSVDEDTGLPHNLVETPTASITETSRRSPDFNERRHPYCGLISSMHSWGLYNGRYGLSNLVLIDRIPQQERHLAENMLAGELERQRRLKAALADDGEASAWLEERHLFQNYKQLQFCDTLALYFNRTHAAERGEQSFEHVPQSAVQDARVTIRPRREGVYELSPCPFAVDGAEFAFAGRRIEPRPHATGVDWSAVLRQTPTHWERFRIVAGRA